MNKFAVGDYIIHENGKTIHRYVSLNYMEQLVPRCEHIKKYLIRIRYIDMYRKATVLDYIRTLSAEQLVKCYSPTGFISGCENCIGCSGAYSCREGKIQWLNQPLTTQIIKQLGGMKE